MYEVPIKIDNQEYYLQINSDNTPLAMRKNDGSNSNLSTDEMNMLLSIINKLLGQDLTLLTGPINELIQNKQINTYEELIAYLNQKGYSKIQIQQISEMFKNSFVNNNLEINESEYESDLDFIKQLMDKPKNKAENLIINFAHEDNNMIKMSVVEYDMANQTQKFINEKTYNYNNILKEKFLNQIVKHTCENHQTITEVIQKDNTAGYYADFGVHNDKNVSLRLADIEKSYAEKLEIIAHENSLHSEDFEDAPVIKMENNDESLVRDGQAYVRIHNKKLPYNNDGFVNMKAFISLLVIAFIAVIIITILINK